MDFTQDVITTIHDLQRADETVEKLVVDACREKTAAVVIPMLYEELKRHPIKLIKKQLMECGHLNEVIIALTAKKREEYERTVRFFKDLPVPTIVIWCEAPHIMEVFTGLKDKGIDISSFTGKGIAVWTAFGIASVKNYAIVLHDADIETYSRGIISRLLLPILDPDLDFYFSKGYYARLTGMRMFGRVSRLFLWPFLDALLIKTEYKSEFLRYFKAFRYPLAGECALTSDLALNLRIPTDWGLEVGMLAEVFRNTALKRICQVDLGVYSHSHKDIEGGAQELRKIVSDVTKTILRTVTESDGLGISEETLLSLQVLYRRIAQEYIRKYYVDARANGFEYDRHEEETIMELFAATMMDAGKEYIREPAREQIPDWLRVLSAVPELQVKLTEATRMEKIRVKLREAALTDTSEVIK
jgi:glucosyl-3-phosphoglycerate synthase